MLYHQLCPEAQERARDNYRRSAEEDEWWDSDYEHWKEKLDDLGFADADIKFSGFSCQGDGASFTACITREFKIPDVLVTRLEDATQVARVLLRFNGKHGAPDLSWSINGKIQRSTSARYVHANTIYANLELENGGDVPEDLANDLKAWVTAEENSLTSEARGLSNEIYRCLESSWDEINCDESVAQNIIELKIDFDKEGTPTCSKIQFLDFEQYG